MGKEIIFVDFETTGLIEADGTIIELQPHAIEVCIIRTNKNLKIVDEFTTLIRPPVEIPAFISKITSIYPNMVMDSPEFSDIYKRIKSIYKGAKVMVAQNLRFDQGVMDIEFKRIGKKLKYPPSLFCTVEQSMHFTGMRLKSTELYDLAVKKQIKNVHRAKADVLAMIQYYKFINSYIPDYLLKRKRSW